MLLSILNNLDLSAKKNLEFDALAHSTKHQKDYEQSQLIQEFSENYQNNPKDTFAPGSMEWIFRYDARTIPVADPILSLWISLWRSPEMGRTVLVR